MNVFWNNFTTVVIIRKENSEFILKIFQESELAKGILFFSYPFLFLLFKLKLSFNLYILYLINLNY